MQFLRDSVVMLLWRALSIGLGAFAAVLVARWLGPDDRGIYALLILWIGLAALLLQFGIPEASIYLIGAKVFPERDTVVTVVAWYAMAAALAVAASAVLGCAISGLGMPRALLAGLALAATVLATGFRHLLLAYRKFGHYSASVAIEGSLFLALICAARLTAGITVNVALAAYASSLVGVSILLAAWLPGGPGRLLALRSAQPVLLAAAARQGMHMFATGLGGFGVQRIGYLLLEALSGTRAVGLFAAASALPTLFSNLPQQLATVLYSHVAADRPDRGARLTTRVAKLMAALGLLMLIPVILFRDVIAVLLFGAEFATIGDALAVLCAGMLMTGLGGILYNALAGTGHAHYGAMLTSFTLVLVTLLGVALIPVLGLEGAALAQLAAATATTVFIAILFCRLLSVSASELLVPSRTDLDALTGRGNSGT